jgi:hypothetical protein
MSSVSYADAVAIGTDEGRALVDVQRDRSRVVVRLNDPDKPTRSARR